MMTPADMRARARVGGLLLGAGIGGFLTGTVVQQVLRWRTLTEGPDERRVVTDVHGLAVAAGLVQVTIWILAVAGIAVLWYSSDRGARPLPGRVVAGWALIGWGALTAALGLTDGILAPDVRRALDVGLVVAGVLLAATGWRVRRATP